MATGRGRAVSVLVLLFSLAAGALSAYAWWNSAGFVVFDDHRWLPSLLALVSTVGLLRAALRGSPFHGRSARVVLGIGGGVGIAYTSVLAAVLCLVALFSHPPSRSAVGRSGDITIVHVLVQPGLSPNVYQYIDVRRGGPLLGRHRVATYYADADFEPWQVTMSGLTLQITSWSNATPCPFDIDASRLALVPTSDDPFCRQLLR